jgi:hypothetical protein
MLRQLSGEPRGKCRFYERQQAIVGARTALLDEQVEANTIGQRQDAQHQAKLRIVSPKTNLTTPISS